MAETTMPSWSQPCGECKQPWPCYDVPDAGPNPIEKKKKRKKVDDRGQVLILLTFMMVLLLTLIGMGLSIGMMAYSRNLGQAAVDFSALSAASGVATGSIDRVREAAQAFNDTNIYHLTSENVELVQYDSAANTFKPVTDIASANGARVSLKYKTPVFLAPAVPLISVTATAVLKARADLPLAPKGCAVGSQKLNACWTVYNRPLSGELDEMIRNPGCQSIPSVSVGTGIDLTPADVTGNYDTLRTHGPFDGSQCYVVPVVRGDSKCNRTDEPILSFARMCIATVPGRSIQADVKSCDLGNLLGVGSRCATSVLVRDKGSGM